jgi:hypothetical protein
MIQILQGGLSESTLSGANPPLSAARNIDHLQLVDSAYRP